MCSCNIKRSKGSREINELGTNKGISLSREGSNEITQKVIRRAVQQIMINVEEMILLNDYKRIY